MRGRSVTGWFALDWEQVEKCLSEELRPQLHAPARARLRFYDIAFSAFSHANPEELDGCGGSFREAAFAVAARYKQVQGEVSALMWSDDETYTTWGREVFGWPVRRGNLALSGPLWECDLGDELTGRCQVSEAYASAELIASGEDLVPSVSGSPGSQCWLTPRRGLLRAGRDGERRDVLAVSARRPGQRRWTKGRLHFDAVAGHPLHGLGHIDAEVEIVDDFEIVVGEDVTLL